MILQTFTNPVWTVDTVGRVYLVLFLIACFVIYHLLDSLKIMISDLVNIISGFIKKLRH